LPQAPQFWGSEATDAQTEPHAVVPPGQVHAEDSHTWVDVHALLQAPQFCGSAVVSTHELPQATNGAVHAATHAPAWQSGAPPEQTVPHAPQFAGSLESSRHVPPHAVPPWGQAQAPAMHAAEVGHAVPQVPQFDGSLAVATHDVPHSVRPTAHADWHDPLAHTRPMVQACPHEPQFCGSLVESTHVPPQDACVAGQGVDGGTPHSPLMHV